MSDHDIARAKSFLDAFVGRAISAVESYEYQLRLVFNDLEFVTSSPWRLRLTGMLKVGSGDIGASGTFGQDALDSVKALVITSTDISPTLDTMLVLSNGYTLEVINDSVQYETWEAHVPAGWVVFSEGGITVFPPLGEACDQ